MSTNIFLVRYSTSSLFFIEEFEMKKTILMTSLMALFTLGAASVYADHHEGGQHESEGKYEMNADANADGKVSYDEFKAAREKHMQEHFNRRDTNKDGFIDQTERDAAKQNWKSKHGKMKDGEKCDRK